jgi:hypothetical protein
METLRQLCVGYLRAGDELAPPGWLDLTPLLGTWRNLDGSTAGVLELVLSRDGERLLVRARAAGTPEPADWGSVSRGELRSPLEAPPSLAWRDCGFRAAGRAKLAPWPLTGVSGPGGP